MVIAQSHKDNDDHTSAPRYRACGNDSFGLSDARIIVYNATQCVACNNVPTCSLCFSHPHP